MAAAAAMLAGACSCQAGQTGFWHPAATASGGLCHLLLSRHSPVMLLRSTGSMQRETASGWVILPCLLCCRTSGIGRRVA